MTSIHSKTALLATNLLSLILTLTTAIPMSHTIKHRQFECLSDKLARNEYVTMSVTILSGDVLKGKATIAGPFAPSTASTASELFALSQKQYRDGGSRSRSNDLYKTYDVSYEEIFDIDDEDDDMLFHDDDAVWDDDMDDVDFKEYYYEIDDDFDDDEFEWEIDDTMTDAEIEELQKAKMANDAMTDQQKQEKREKRREEKKKNLEQVLDERKAIKAKREEKKRQILKEKKQREMTREEREISSMKSGEAYERTHRVSTEGWYMVCLEATYSEIVAEFEMRKSSDVGNPHHKTGHLMTYEHHEMVQKEKKLFMDSRREEEKVNPKEGEAKVDSIEEKDLDNSKAQIQRLNRLLSEIKGKQQNERHRLSIHSALNEHSHSRMVLCSLFETVFYILVSGFQVYTIRKWFKGNPILGY